MAVENLKIHAFDILHSKGGDQHLWPQRLHWMRLHLCSVLGHPMRKARMAVEIWKIHVFDCLHGKEIYFLYDPYCIRNQ
jgi:hypothetical protein